MNQIRFDWDARKARSNEKKHGVSFEEAQSVFFDEQALLLEDPRPLHEEERFVLLGLERLTPPSRGGSRATRWGRDPDHLCAEGEPPGDTGIRDSLEVRRHED